MAANYILQPNEVVLIKESNVSYGGKLSFSCSGLVLTNLNLILLKQGFFGNSKGNLTFPLNQIKVHNGQPQALIGVKGAYNYVLEVYFLDGMQQFGFQTGGKRKIQQWISKINYAVTGVATPAPQGSSRTLSAFEGLADQVKDTIDLFRLKPEPPPPPPPVRVAGKCWGCGAPAGGFRGQVIHCGYCGSPLQL